MQKSGKQGIELLKQWDTFTDRQPTGTITEFAQWLLSSADADTDRQSLTPASAMPGDARAGLLLGRLARFSVLWSKKMFDNVPLRTIEEYGILKIIERSPGMRKSDVAYHSLLEPTTCFEILKRLKKMDLVVDEADETDRRSRQVRITEEGERLAHQIDARIMRLSTLLLGRLNDEEKESLTQLLELLNDFHEEVYSESREASLEEIMAAHLPEVAPRG